MNLEDIGSFNSEKRRERLAENVQEVKVLLLTQNDFDSKE